MKKRLTAALLSCLLLAGCGGQTPSVSAQPEPSVRSGSIAYVPLDDRPDNAERVKYLANSLGYGLLMPEEDWYQTKLDGQPLNANGTQYGDRAKLYEWVLQQEEKGCDRYILFLDQLHSGGLVNSRHVSGSRPVTLSDGTVLSETQLVENLMTTLAADQNNRVWLLDTVMRLAPTCGYDGFGLDEYNNLRAYGMEPRPELAGEELHLERVIELYGQTRTGESFVSEDFGLSGEVVADYLSARCRKLELSDRVFRLLENLGNEFYPGLSGDTFRVLIGIDDSSAEDSIQKNEIALLRQKLRTDGERQLDWLLSGVDDLAFKAVTRLYLDECEAAGPSLAERELNRIYIHYAGGTQDQPACPYDSQPLEEIVAEHLAFFGLEQAASREEADLQMLVLTQPDPTGEGTPGWPHGYWAELVEELKDYTDLPTILMDAANNRYGTAFHDALMDDARLGQLLGYAGFLDMAIVTGTALSHGVARYAWLAQGNGASEGASHAYRKSLAEALVLDFCYRNTVRDELSAYVREVGGDPNNFYAPAIDTEAMRLRLEEGMAKSSKPMLKNLSASNFITDPEAYDPSTFSGMAGWGSITMENWRFPWQRVFEVRMDIIAGPPKEPHKSLFAGLSQVFMGK